MHETHGTVNALILEDEPRFRGFLSEVVREMDCTPIPAATGADAMRIVETDPPDMLFLDLNLPYVDGMTFLGQFRERCPHAPVVIITGYGDLESARQAIRHGVTDFLTKPCDLAQLEQAIDRARKHIVRHEKCMQARTESNACTEAQAEVRPLEAVEREAIMEALRITEGNRSAAARRLGISRRAVYNKIEEYRKQGFEIP